jgi:iron complex transport system substrate-binding protein
VRACLRLLAVLVATLAAVAPAAAESVPVRIVSLAPSATETLFALGVGDRVVGVSDYCDYPPAVSALPRIGSFVTPSVEAIIALEPDLVIGLPSPGNLPAVRTLERAGLRVEIVRPDRLVDVAPTTRRIAALAGVPDAGERLVAKMDAAMAAVRARVATAPRRRVLMVIGRAPLVAVGPESFLGDLLDEARAVNLAPAATEWPHLSVEYVIAADPEVVIDSSMGTEAAYATADFWLRLESLTAVRTGQVHPFRSYRVLRPGPRLAAAFADLARVIHPERWRDGGAGAPSPGAPSPGASLP